MMVLDMSDMWDKYDWYDFINMQDDNDDSHGNAFPKEFVKLVEEYQNMPEEERLLRLSKLSPKSREFLSRKLGGCKHD